VTVGGISKLLNRAVFLLDIYDYLGTTRLVCIEIRGAL